MFVRFLDLGTTKKRQNTAQSMNLSPMRAACCLMCINRQHEGNYRLHFIDTQSNNSFFFFLSVLRKMIPRGFLCLLAGRKWRKWDSHSSTTFLLSLGGVGTLQEKVITATALMDLIHRFDKAGLCLRVCVWGG